MKKYCYSIEMIGGDSTTEFDLFPEELKGKLDYYALDSVINHVRFLINGKGQLAYAFQNISCAEIVEDLILLCRAGQNEIINVISIPEEINGKNISPYLETIWFYLYFSKKIDLNADNIEKLITSLVNQDNDFVYLSDSFHLLELAMLADKNLSAQNFYKIVAHFTCQTPYFENKNADQYMEGIIKTNHRPDWRSIIIASENLQVDKQQIMKKLFTDEDIKKTRDMYEDIIFNHCLKINCDCIDDTGWFDEYDYNIDLQILATKDMNAIMKLTLFRIFCLESRRREQIQLESEIQGLILTRPEEDV